MSAQGGATSSSEGMLEEMSRALADYQTKWTGLIASRHTEDFFKNAVPTAIGWKVQDLAEFDRRYAVLRELSDQIHLGWIDGRWLATLHLKDSALLWGITVIKIMQRRPGSTDATGLDHVDFHISETTDIPHTLTSEPNLKWTEEYSGKRAKWYSLWFQGTEAKLRYDTVLAVCAKELYAVEQDILGAS